MEWIYLTGGVIAGALMVSVYYRMRSRGQAEVELKELELYRKDREKNLEDLRSKEATVINLTRELATRTSDYNHLSEQFKEHKAEIVQMQDIFKAHFKDLANEILEEKSKKFTEVNKQKIEEILKPLDTNIANFRKKVEETYDRESKERFALDKEVKRLMELNQQISEDANRLTEALKGESKTQGNWGEMILESILGKSGLEKDREYVIQESVTMADGRRLQPDVIIHLPGDRNMIIDAKVSLRAYERYSSATDEADEEKARKEHMLSVKNHINELSSKNYSDIYRVSGLDFVMMFMPIEPAYLLAVHTDKEIWNYAYEKRILLVSPTNLIALLKMVANLWRHEYQAKNVQEIARQSGNLLDKFYALLKDLDQVGTQLKSTQKSYDDAINKLSEGKGNLISRAEKIKELGARSKKTLPDKFAGSLTEDNDS